ncbi:hypothetical protein ACUN9V_05715 [Salinicola sp. V024]|uniref:hypothetical protein n=1 Tax=Salinicola sp. V024 TaxID=3459609 RepID=UPI0040444441
MDMLNKVTRAVDSGALTAQELDALYKEFNAYRESVNAELMHGVKADTFTEELSRRKQLEFEQANFDRVGRMLHNALVERKRADVYDALPERVEAITALVDELDQLEMKMTGLEAELSVASKSWIRDRINFRISMDRDLSERVAARSRVTDAGLRRGLVDQLSDVPRK